MKTKIRLVIMLALPVATLLIAKQAGVGRDVPPPRPQGPRDIYVPKVVMKLTSTQAWQKTWQKKTAEEGRIVQEIAGRRDSKNSRNAAENGVLAT